MNSQILLSFLESIPLDLGSVPDYIESLDIFPIGDKHDILRQIAYHVTNPDTILPLYIEEIAGKIYPVYNVESLYASVYLGQGITVYSLTHSVYLKEVLGQIEVKPYDGEAELNIEQIVKLATQWDNEAYVLSVLGKTDVAFLAKNIDPAFWKNQHFLNSVMEINPTLLSQLEPEMGHNEEFLSFFLRAAQHWNDHTQLIWTHFFRDFFALSRPQLPVFAHRVSEKIATQPELMLNLLKNSGPHYLKKLYHVATDEIKMLPEVMGYILKTSNNAGEILIDIKDIPEVFF